jgi:hypothetical protein
MKTQLLKLSLLAALLTGVASASANDDTVKLSPVIVNSPRYLDAEKQVEDNLAELREAAQAPLSLKVELPSFTRKAPGATKAKLPEMALRQTDALRLRLANKA